MNHYNIYRMKIERDRTPPPLKPVNTITAESE